jgi:hypothetical protein
MRTCLFVLFAAVACSASAGIIVNIPSLVVPPPSAPTDLSLDVSFALTAPTVSQQLLAYDLFLGVTGGNGFSITGVGTGSDRPPNTVFGDDQYYNDQLTNPAGATLYWFCNCPSMGPPYGTIYNGSVLLRIKAQLQPGATGTYHIDPYVNQWARPGDSTDFFSDINENVPGYLVKITDITCPGATVTVTLPGDANLDCKVDINDLTKVLANYNMSASMNWGTGDFNNDGKVDINDLTIVLANYNQTLGSARAEVAPVPEPSTLVLIGVGAVGAFGYLRRRQKPTT